MSCPSNKIINVESANYGRTDKGTCPHPHDYDDTCYSIYSFPVVSQHCNGQNSCSIGATNFNFGDPCKGTYKYLDVKFKCV